MFDGKICRSILAELRKLGTNQLVLRLKLQQNWRCAHVLTSNVLRSTIPQNRCDFEWVDVRLSWPQNIWIEWDARARALTRELLFLNDKCVINLRVWRNQTERPKLNDESFLLRAENKYQRFLSLTVACRDKNHSHNSSRCSISVAKTVFILNEQKEEEKEKKNQNAIINYSREQSKVKQRDDQELSFCSWLCNLEKAKRNSNKKWRKLL